MADEKTIIMTPDNQYPGYAYPAFGGAGNGFGSFNSIADLFGLAIIASMFGWGNGGFGGGFGNWGGGNAAGFLSNQLNNDSGRELIMNAVTSQGEAGRAATQNLATALGQDFDLVNSGVQNVQNALNALAVSHAVSVPQIINALQSGDAALSRQLCECCCENRLLTTEQGYQAQIRTIEQTNQLGSQADRNTASVVGAINALHTDMTREFCAVKEREMQEKINTQGDIITQLRGQIDNAAQTSQIASMIAPLAREVDDIKCRMPQTVPVQWPQLTAVNTTPYVSGGFYGGLGFGGWGGFGNGFGGNIVF